MLHLTPTPVEFPKGSGPPTFTLPAICRDLSVANGVVGQTEDETDKIAFRSNGFDRNARFHASTVDMFSSTILEACCKQYFPRPATEIALFDIIRLMPPAATESTPPHPTLDIIKRHLCHYGLKCEYVEKLVQRWKELAPESMLANIVIPRDIAMHAALICCSEATGNKRKAGTDHGVGGGQEGTGENDESGGGYGEGEEEEGQDGRGGGDGNGDGNGEQRGSPSMGPDAKRLKRRDERKFHNVVHHDSAMDYLAYLKVGREITEAGVREGEAVSGKNSALDVYKLNGFFSIFHGTTFPGLRSLRETGVWESHAVARNRDLSANFGVYFSSSPAYALMHSVLRCGLTTDFRSVDTYKAVIIENFLTAKGDEFGVVRKEHMQEFYANNRISNRATPGLPGFVLGGWLPDDKDLAAGTFAFEADGEAIVHAGFDSVQLAVVGEFAVQKINQENNVVHVVNVTKQNFQTMV